MEKIKEFYSKNKKIVIPVAIILVLLIAVGVFFLSQPNDHTNKKAEHQTEEKMDISQDDKNEGDMSDAEQSTDNAADQPSDDEHVSDNDAGNSDNNTSGKPATDNAANQPSNDKHASNNDAGNSGNNNSSSKPATPTHTHSWKEHTVTEQVWVSNIVPVYETQKVQVGTNKISEGIFWHCNCGAVVPMNDSDDHVFAHIEAGEMDNGYTKEHFREEPVYEEKQVQVGTKDEGHYETKTYVDYKYCDCGAKQ